MRRLIAIARLGGRIPHGIRRILPLLVLTGLLSPAAPRPGPTVAPPPPALVGFSYSPKVAADAHIDPVRGLGALLWRLHPDIVRLPVYWDQVAPSPDRLDFTAPDRLVAAVEAYDHADPRHRHTTVLLVVGARNLANPEVHTPSWASRGEINMADVIQIPEYQVYLDATFAHYAQNPLLYAWQVENEPLDNTNPFIGDVALPASVLGAEIDKLRATDPTHPIVITTYDSATVVLDQHQNGSLSWFWNHLPGPKGVGHPAPALQLGDALGLDAYVVTPTTPLEDASALTRIGWKRDALEYWWEQAKARGKQLWITEMQASPWEGEGGFDIPDMFESAQAYRTSGASMVLLWGVEDWLKAPEWMSAGQRAVSVLRGLG